MNKIIKQDENLDKAIESLLKGDVLVIPTETVYGLAVVYDNYEAYEKLNSIKRRTPDTPYTLMLSRKVDIYKYAEVGENAKQIIDTFLPGPLTIILKAKKGLPSWVINSKDGSIGIRFPSRFYTQTIIDRVGKPLLVTSVNRHGQEPMNDLEAIKKEFGEEISYIIEAMEPPRLIPSTIISAIDNVKLIRKGLISLEDIENVLKKE